MAIGTGSAFTTPPPESTETTYIQATAGEITLPGGFTLTSADFAHVGVDLVLTAPGGAQIVIRGFFDFDFPPELVSAEGAHVPGDLAVKLAGPLAPGQVAQAGPLSQPEPIGQVENVDGEVVAIRPDGTRIILEVGDPVFQGDVLESGDDGAIGIVLADETSFSMAENGRMVLDEMVYDPGTQEGSIALSVMQGVFTFISGEVAKSDPGAMTVQTPVATIGIRGTQVGIALKEGEPMKLILMEEGDGFVGEVVVENEAGVQILNQANQGVTVASADQAPSKPQTVSPEAIAETYGKALLSMPESANVNTYGAEEAAAAAEEGEAEEAAADEEAGEEEAENLEDLATAAGGGEGDGGDEIEIPDLGVAGDDGGADDGPDLGGNLDFGGAGDDLVSSGGGDPDPADPDPVDPPPADPTPNTAPTVEGDKILVMTDSDSDGVDFDIEAPGDVDGNELTITVGDIDALLAFGSVETEDGTDVVSGDTLSVDQLTDLHFHAYETQGTVSATFTYTVSDGAGGADTGSIDVTVNDGDAVDSGGDTQEVTQWASEVLGFSSEYGGGWSAAMTLGEPTNLAQHGDYTGAWTPSSSDGGLAYIELGYETEVYASGVTIYESDGQEFVTKIEVRDPEGDYYVVWEGTDDTVPLWNGSIYVPQQLSVEFDATSYLVDGLRITIDKDAGEGGWEEIDAVQLQSGGAELLGYTITGGDGNDVLLGGGGDDDIAGGAGNDDIEGGDGVDFIEGEGGDDIIFGGDGFDLLAGGLGDDVLHGGDDGSTDLLFGGDHHVVEDFFFGDGGGGDFADDGNDVMTGGDGSDVFMISSHGGSDIITDFNSEDALVLMGAEFEELDPTITQVGSDTVVTFDFNLLEDPVDNIITITLQNFTATDLDGGGYDIFSPDEEGFGAGIIIEGADFDSTRIDNFIDEETMPPMDM